MTKMGLIVAGFPGVGKSKIVNDEMFKELTIVDSDSSSYSNLDVDQDGKVLRNPEFPLNYVDMIESEISKVDIRLISTHSSVLDVLDIRGLEYFIVVPTLDQKYIYLDRYRNRGSSEEFIQMMEENYDSFVEQLLNRPNGIKIVLDQYSHLSDKIDLIINR